MVGCWACEGTGWFRSSVSNRIIQSCHCDPGMQKRPLYIFVSLVQRLMPLSDAVSVL